MKRDGRFLERSSLSQSQLENSQSDTTLSSRSRKRRRAVVEGDLDEANEEGEEEPSQRRIRPSVSEDMEA